MRVMSDPITGPWLTIIGIGEDGLDGLCAASKAAIADAETVFGGPRHLTLAGLGADLGAHPGTLGDTRGTPWTVPFSIQPVLDKRNRKTVILASGDPFWFGAGGSITSQLSAGDWVSYPGASIFSLIAGQMGWRIEETLCMGLHAAPFEQMVPVLAPGRKVICTLRDRQAPKHLATWLTDSGFGASEMTVFEATGGPNSKQWLARADSFDHSGISAPVAAAITAQGAHGLPQAAGLPDDRFANDGQITKRPIRALSLPALQPRYGDTLWDIGAGSGSISVEFLLAAPNTKATAFETRPDRAQNIIENARKFGLSHRLETIIGTAGDEITKMISTGMAPPNTVFVGGGASAELIALIWDVVPEGTRIVANAVTLETESLLMQEHSDKGGDLLRVELAEAAPLGRMRGWNRARPVIQWSVTR